MEALDPILQGLVALLREVLTPDQRALFLALSERDLAALTSTLSMELSISRCDPGSAPCTGS